MTALVDEPYNDIYFILGADENVSFMPYNYEYDLYKQIGKYLKLNKDYKKAKDKPLIENPFFIKGLTGPRRIEGIPIEYPSVLTFRVHDDDCANVVNELIYKSFLINKIQYRFKLMQMKRVSELVSTDLVCDRVIFTDRIHPNEFLMEAHKKLNYLNLKSFNINIQRPFKAISVSKLKKKSPYVKRTMKFRKHILVGYAVNIKVDNHEDAYKLMINGLGTKKKFGCGVFYPTPPTPKNPAKRTIRKPKKTYANI